MTKLIAIVLLLLISPGGANAAPSIPMEWSFEDVRFIDGGVLSGYMVYDSLHRSVLYWNVRVSGGDESVFPPFIYDSATSITAVLFGNSRPGESDRVERQPNRPGEFEPFVLIFRQFPQQTPGPDGFNSRDLRISPERPLNGEELFVPIGLLGDGSGYLSLECRNCFPLREIVQGGFEFRRYAPEYASDRPGNAPGQSLTPPGLVCKEQETSNQRGCSDFSVGRQ
jgi:hypothetical protein